MKKWMGLLITIIIEAAIVYGLTKVLGWKFVDLTFFMGVVFILLAYISSSKGGFFSAGMSATVQGMTGMKTEGSGRHQFTMTPFFLGSVIYTVISLVVMIIAYWGYFVK